MQGIQAARVSSYAVHQGLAWSLPLMFHPVIELSHLSIVSTARTPLSWALRGRLIGKFGQ